MVDRTDIVRIFVDIPEQDANYVQIGTKATVLARAFRDQPIPATVTRTSWALNVKSRTLRAEIDLPNPDSQLLPGMYAYAKVIIERPGVRALPLDALVYSGDQTFCWTIRERQARSGPRSRRASATASGSRSPTAAPARPRGRVHRGDLGAVDGSEQVILGDLSILTDGGPVQVATATANTTELTQNESVNRGPGLPAKTGITD